MARGGGEPDIAKSPTSDKLAEEFGVYPAGDGEP